MYRLLDFENKEKIIKIINSIPYFKLEKDDDLTATSFYSIFDENENEIGFFGLESREYNLCFCYFYIYEPFRNKGYAKQILNEIISDFKNKYGYIYGFVDEENDRAIKIYKNYLFLKKDTISFCKVYDFNKQKDELFKTENGYEVVFYFNGHNLMKSAKIKNFNIEKM